MNHVSGSAGFERAFAAAVPSVASSRLVVILRPRSASHCLMESSHDLGIERSCTQKITSDTPASLSACSWCMMSVLLQNSRSGSGSVSKAVVARPTAEQRVGHTQGGGGGRSSRRSRSRSRSRSRDRDRDRDRGGGGDHGMKRSERVRDERRRSRSSRTGRARRRSPRARRLRRRASRPSPRR